MSISDSSFSSGPRIVALVLGLLASARAQDAVLGGALSSPYPTLQHLAVEWEVQGDANHNASASMRFRPEGAANWVQGRALRAIPSGRSRKALAPFSWSQRFSGSLMDLKPGQAYEIEVSLSDPDGGSVTKTLRQSTRPEPAAAADAKARRGGRELLNAAKPGDLILLEDGDYGAVSLNRDGEPGRPIVYRAVGSQARFAEIGMTGRKWVHLEGLQVNGPIRLNQTQHCVVRRCRIRSSFGIKAYKPGMENALIEDNDIEGIRPWKPEIMGANGDNEGEGIQFTGSGNVVRHNRVRGFRDCISHLEDDSAALQACNDIHHNDISAGLDDGIEADFAAHNCRVHHNRITNCFVGISSQPGLGGPNYFYRNVLFNVIHEAFKISRESQGDVIEHNTVIKSGDGFGIYTSEAFDGALITHNLFVACKPIEGAKYNGYGPGRGRAVDVQNFGPNCRIDHNAYAVIGMPFEGKIGSWTFNSLPAKAHRANPRLHEAHGRILEWPVALKLPLPLEPAQFYTPPDLSALNQAGAYSGEGPPHYGPRP